MKPIISLAIATLLTYLLMMTAHAGTVTTTTTTVTTVKKTTGCYVHKKHYKKHYRHRCYSCSRGCVSGGCYGYYYDNWDRCPGGDYDCYYDTRGNWYSQSYIPVSYGHNVYYRCLESEDPSSCS